MKLRKLLTATTAATALTIGVAPAAPATPADLANGSFEQISGSWAGLPNEAREGIWYALLPAFGLAGLAIVLIQGTTGICISSDSPDCSPVG